MPISLSQPYQPLQFSISPRARDPNGLRVSEYLRVTTKNLEPGFQPVLKNLISRRIEPPVQRLAGGIDDAVQLVVQPPTQVRKDGPHLIPAQRVRLNHHEPMPLQILVAPTVTSGPERRPA